MKIHVNEKRQFGAYTQKPRWSSVNGPGGGVSLITYVCFFKSMQNNYVFISPVAEFHVYVSCVLHMDDLKTHHLPSTCLLPITAQPLGMHKG